MSRRARLWVLGVGWGDWCVLDVRPWPVGLVTALLGGVFAYGVNRI